MKKVIKYKQNQFSLALILGAFVGSSGCGSNGGATVPEDASASGAAAGAVGGALSGSSSGGTLAYWAPPKPRTYWEHPWENRWNKLMNGINWLPNALASVSCPTYRTTGTGCVTSGSSMWLSYSSCTFGGTNSWNGTLSLIASSGSTGCGTFPGPSSGTLIRQFETGSLSAVPGSGSITSSYGTTATVDNTGGSNLSNFNGDTITPITGGGYGEDIAYTSGARTSVLIAERIYTAAVFDHTISGTVTVTETAGATSRTVSGSLTVYHNSAKVIGTATFNSVVHSDSCCYPVGGSIATSFAAGSNVSPTTTGLAMKGKTELLSFNGSCGSATFTNTSGTSATVTLSHCF